MPFILLFLSVLLLHMRQISSLRAGLGLPAKAKFSSRLSGGLKSTNVANVKLPTFKRQGRALQMQTQGDVKDMLQNELILAPLTRG